MLVGVHPPAMISENNTPHEPVPKPEAVYVTVKVPPTITLDEDNDLVMTAFETSALASFLSSCGCMKNITAPIIIIAKTVFLFIFTILACLCPFAYCIKCVAFG